MIAVVAAASDHDVQKGMANTSPKYLARSPVSMLSAIPFLGSPYVYIHSLGQKKPHLPPVPRETSPSAVRLRDHSVRPIRSSARVWTFFQSG